ncbi:MAG: FeoA family protein [Smithella sp.]|jgi:Fe2+ transport system protein FeoA
MTLLKMKIGNTAVVKKFNSAKHIASRMSDLGFHAGKRIRLLRTGLFHGPLLVEDMECGAKIMISREIASCIEVEREEIK